MTHGKTIAALAERLKRETGLLIAWVGMPDPLVAGQLALEDFDAVTLDMQHGAQDLRSIALSIPSITLAGKPTIVRIPVGDFASASRVLDLGVAGVIAPMINSKADAEAFAAAVKYPPVGGRSWGPTIAFALAGHDGNAYLAGANATTVSIAMIETREALASLDDILAVPGIDAVFVGPSDLSIALSDGANVDPQRQDVADALIHVAERAKAHGKVACCFAPSPQHVPALAKAGYGLLAIGTDFGQLRAGARAQIATARARD